MLYKSVAETAGPTTREGNGAAEAVMVVAVGENMATLMGASCAQTVGLEPKEVRAKARRCGTGRLSQTTFRLRPRPADCANAGGACTSVKSVWEHGMRPCHLSDPTDGAEEPGTGSGVGSQLRSA